MGKPLHTLLSSIITIERSKKRSIYLQIAEQLAFAIQRSVIPEGAKMPGTRSLSELLNVHRSTVIAAYEELSDLGYLRVLANKGAFVMPITDLQIAKTKPELLGLKLSYPTSTGYAFRKTNVLDDPFEANACDLVFTDGTPDLRLTQIDVLSSAYSANLKRVGNRRKMGDPYLTGSNYFREQLANYLNLSRGLRISHRNLLISRGLEMGLYTVCQTLLCPKDVVVVGAPSSFSANMVFQQSGASILQIPMDDGGIIIDKLEAFCKNTVVRMLYLTPHHHYPTTTSLCPTRREKVLSLASKYGFIVVEDDYDFEFNYGQKTLLPMASVDTGGMVIYIGNIGRTLAPGFRTGFVIAPENLIDELRKRMSIIDRQGDVLMEQALGELIEEGQLTRYIKRSLSTYKSRRDYLADGLQKDFKDFVDFYLPTGGLALWTRWRSDINLLKISKVCARKGLFIPKVLLYQTADINAVRIGFGHLEPHEMDQSLGILRESLRYF